MRLRPPPPKRDPLEKLLASADFTGVPLAIVSHSQAIPLGVLVRGTMEWLVDDQVVERIFQEAAPEQYTRELTISALIKLLVQVSTGMRRSVFAAFKAD